jgi:hypothetical protein
LIAGFGKQDCNEQQELALKTEKSSKKKAKAFDTRLFKRILYYTKQWRFNGVIAFAISLLFAALRPYLLKANCRRLHQTEDARGFVLHYLMGVVLLAEVFRSFILFIGQTGWDRIL